MRYFLRTLMLVLGINSVFAQNPFIITVNTANPGTSGSTAIEIPVDSSGNTFSYDVDWDNDGVYDDFGLQGNATHDYGIPGTYTIRITGTFPYIKFDGGGDCEKLIDINQWGDISWRNFFRSFHGCANMDISATDAPDLSLVTNFRSIFANCTSFNSNINHWDVGNVEVFYRCFQNCTSFNQPLDNWDMSSADNLDRMFIGCTSFNQPLNSWDVSNATIFSSMFSGASSFNQPLDNWDVSSVKLFSFMFSAATTFNQDISMWNTSSATTMRYMFNEASSFNQPIGSWDLSSVTRIDGMFKNANSFNSDISQWNTSQVTNMSYTFFGSSFNQPIGIWDVSNVTSMGWMFAYNNAFNQDIGSWDVSNVTAMHSMLRAMNNFNQDIGNWDVSKVTNMASMFEGTTTFDQDLSAWNVSNVTNMTRMFNGDQLSTEYYDNMLIAWSMLPLQDSVIFHAGYSIYCQAWAERANIISTFHWEITDRSETTPPVTMCKDTTVYLHLEDTVILTALMLDNGSYDTCTGVNYLASQTVFTCADLGTVEDTLTVTDMNGNSDYCISNVTVLDTTGILIASCPGDTTLTDSEANCDGIITWNEPTYHCNVVNYYSDYESGDTFDIGTTTVTYTAVDVLSNMETCSFDITITVGSPTMLVDAGTDLQVCETTTSVSLTGSVTTVSGGSWSGEGTFSDSTNLTTSYSPTTTEITADSAVILLTADDNGICPGTTDTVIIYFETNETPLITIDSITSFCTNSTIGFKMDSSSAGGSSPQYSWQVNGIPVGETGTTFYSNNFSTGDQVSLEMTSSTLCQNGNVAASNFIEIVLEDCSCQPIIPNAFSPNNDGSNDTWVIDLGGCYELNQVSIYNRWGSEIYKGYQIEESVNWDGKRNEKELPVTTYYYVIEVIDLVSNEIKTLTGAITLIR